MSEVEVDQLNDVAAGEHEAVSVIVCPTVGVVVGADKAQSGVPAAAPVMEIEPVLIRLALEVRTVCTWVTPAGGTTTVADEVVCPLGVQSVVDEPDWPQSFGNIIREEPGARVMAPETYPPPPGPGTCAMGEHGLDVCASAPHAAKSNAIPAMRAPAEDIRSPIDLLEVKPIITSTVYAAFAPLIYSKA